MFIHLLLNYIFYDTNILIDINFTVMLNCFQTQNCINYKREVYKKYNFFDRQLVSKSKNINFVYLIFMP